MIDCVDVIHPHGLVRGMVEEALYFCPVVLAEGTFRDHLDNHACEADVANLCGIAGVHPSWLGIRNPRLAMGVYIEVDAEENIPTDPGVAVRQGWNVGSVDGKSRFTSGQLNHALDTPYTILEKKGEEQAVLVKFDHEDQEYLIGFFM